MLALLRGPISAVPQIAQEEPCVRTLAGGREIRFLSDPTLLVTGPVVGHADSDSVLQMEEAKGRRGDRSLTRLNCNW
jgi:hypothetical protein